MRIISICCLLISFYALNAQPNCEAYKYYKQDLKYKACKTAEQRKGHYQFSRAYQEAFDDALAIDSTFDYAYRAKSTAYLKSGDFITWKSLMDQAVALAPKDHLDYRGWCRYQFFKDYKGAIADIERLDSLISYGIGYSVNGEYHLQIARAICYRALGDPATALRIIKDQLSVEGYDAGLYDYLHLGVTLLDLEEYEQAVVAFKQQQERNDLAENRFYLSRAYKALGNMEVAKETLDIAESKYVKKDRMFDVYAEQMDKIYLADIMKEKGAYKK